MSEIVNVNSSNFSTEVLESDIPVIVDFWAPWCAPCKALSPVLDAAASELSGRAKVVKVNVDDCPDLAGQFGVRGIPTMICFEGGEPKDQLVGAVAKDAILNLVD